MAGRGALRGLALRVAVTPDVRGLEYLRELPGPFIFVANHPSALDETLLREVLKHATGRLVVVAVERRRGLSGLSEQARGLRSASRLRSLLKRGWSVLLFAEKTRADDGTLAEFDLGAARLGIESGVPLVPVALQGTF